MKICLIGESSGNLDEAMRKTTYYYSDLLSHNHQVILLDPRNIFSIIFWRSLCKFNPDIIHYLHGPTIKSLMLLKLISVYCPDSKIVISAMRPFLSRISKEFVRLLKPDLVLTQSTKSDNMFKNFGCQTEFVPSGVDLNKFKPISSCTKNFLKSKYGLDNNKFTILHIGSIKKGRNIQSLAKLQNDNNQVLIVGSLSVGTDQEVYRALKSSGCILCHKNVNRINEIYALADCYIYPVVDKYDHFGRSIADSIEMPLTVLEAMACNIPVISTKFGALPRCFKEGEGLFYHSNYNELLSALDLIKNHTEQFQIKTRNKVFIYSWENVIAALEKVYEDLHEG